MSYDRVIAYNKVTLLNSKADGIEIADWCRDNITAGSWFKTKGAWYFADEDDATLFRLRWL